MYNIGTRATSLRAEHHAVDEESVTNAYYSRIGMKTRVAEEDYYRVGTRVAGAVLLVLGLIVAYRIVLSGH
jgi:hypothetical protein